MVCGDLMHRLLLVGRMRGKLAVAALVCGLSIGLIACEGSAKGACGSAEGIAAKITTLTDDIATAQGTGKLDAVGAGEIAAKIMAAGTRFEGDKDYRAYCSALDQIRKEAGL